MTNPYQTNHNAAADATKLRSVRGWGVCSVICGVSAWPPLSIGLRMLSDQLGLVSVSSGIYDIEINGVAVSNETFVVVSLSFGLLLVFATLGFAGRAWWNARHNAVAASSLFGEEAGAD